jgi:hypothetical protein
VGHRPMAVERVRFGDSGASQVLGGGDRASDLVGRMELKVSDFEQSGLGAVRLSGHYGRDCGE